jgi:alpha-D-ribose 1-methylphosphonate 5-triphosphate synthase subunit PhnG
VTDPSLPDPTAPRRHWMALLAKADPAVLEAYWRRFQQPPRYRTLRPAETGLVMLRGRISGSGAAFNFGEMTMTRCVIELESGIAGYAHIAGRSRRHAELAAVYDALLQDEHWHDAVERDLIEPLATEAAQRRTIAQAEIAATRVNFFTIARGG